jgi:protein-disulfide isomerase
MTPTRTRTGIFIAVAAAAAVLAAVLIALSQLGAHKSSSPPAPAPGAADTIALLRGIPQQGPALGDPDAPVTLVEYADLQCPYCAQWATATLPTLVRDYVRTGHVRLVFRGLAFIGPDSELALRSALAAGQQNRLWQVVHLLYTNQGEENTGWVSEDLLRSVGSAVPGLDEERVLDGGHSAAVDTALAAAAGAATDAGVTGTPTFEVGRTGGVLARLEIASLDASAFRPALDRLLRSRA